MEGWPDHTDTIRITPEEDFLGKVAVFPQGSVFPLNRSYEIVPEAD
jgi:hypothetical protein